MRIAVTGGTGFLGARIATELARRGHEPVIIDHRTPSSTVHEFIQADVRRFSDLEVALTGCSAVYHCAAIADLDEARKDPRLAVDVNVLGTLTLLEAAATSGVTRVMHASSVYVFARSGSVYRTTKQAAEHLIEDLSEQWGLSSTILRFGSLYGPGADRNNAILRLVTQAVESGRIDFWGNGTEVREYIHIADAAALAVDALDERFSGECIHVTGRERLTTRELLEMIAEMLGGGVEINLRDEPFEGRYRLTPYAHPKQLGSRITSDTYIDLGLGLLEMLSFVSDQQLSEGPKT